MIVSIIEPISNGKLIAIKYRSNSFEVPKKEAIVT